MSEIETKKCGRCGETKPVSEFYRNAKISDGLDYYCKECHKAAARASYANKASKKRIEETNNALSKYTPRDLLTELKRRGYKWEKMYCLQEIKYENIQSMLRDDLIEWAHRYNVRSFIENDPVQFVHKFKDTRDIEVAGMLVSWISWGNRRAIINKGKEIMTIMQWKPYDFLMNEEHKRFKGQQAKIYRIFSYDDFYKLCESMRLVYEGFGSMGNKMRVYAGCRYDHALRQMFGHCYGIPSLFSPSAAKRVNMFLRWMVRKDDVDVGVWSDFLDKSRLLIPIDTHVMRMAMELGITSQKTANEKAMLEITEYFKGIFPDDPCMGDFALFGYGVNNK